MKKALLRALIILPLFCFPVWGHDVTGEPTMKAKKTTYTVHVTLKYNAATEQEAAQLVKQVLAIHGDEACKVKVGVEKNNGTDTHVDIVNGTGTFGHTLTILDTPPVLTDNDLKDAAVTR